MAITLDKITYRNAVADHGHLQIIGRVTKISVQHVWIMARSVTGTRTRTEYPAPPFPVKVDRQGCFLYR